VETQLGRIVNDIENISSITATPGNGCTRFSYSNEDLKAREYLMEKMRDIGLAIKVDAVGNIRAKLFDENNKDNSSIMIGSHIDTVLNGGKFDGLTGVVTALEVIRVIKENNIKCEKPIELVIFAEEEGSNFDVTLLGSKALTANYTVEDLKRISNDKGNSAYEVMKKFGLDIDNLPNETLKDEEIEAMIELHVEQGGVLDKEDIPVGIVEAIAGMKTLRVSVKGVSNHAGSTPMNLRLDPMVASAELITSIKDAAIMKSFPTTVATVGKINITPNRTNVIPKEVEFFVDIRDVKEEGIECIENELKKKSIDVIEKYGVAIHIEEIGMSDVVHLSRRVTRVIEESAIVKGIKYMKINSGAVHDSAMLSEVTDVGMIFVPSIGGYSHCPEELTKYEDIKLGCDLLLEAVINLSNRPISATNNK
jgi:hydantoinase/carbamoylase family amidase